MAYTELTLTELAYTKLVYTELAYTKLVYTELTNTSGLDLWPKGSSAAKEIRASHDPSELNNTHWDSS